MNENFLRFKERQNKLRMLAALMIGGASGLAVGGLCLILSKLDVLGFAPIISLPVGILVLAAVFSAIYFLARQSDKQLARRLDTRFDLKEKVQTMVDFGDEDGDMVLLQREDTERELSQIPEGYYSLDKLWIYLTALGISAVMLIVGFAVPNIWKQHQNPPFSLSEFQLQGLSELIRHVETSDMEEQYRTPIVNELSSLLSELGTVDNERDMRAALASSMAVICDITYRSSSAAEVLDLLWDTNDRYLRYMAKWLDTSGWSIADEGDYADKLIEYLHILLGDIQPEDEDEQLSDEELLDALTRALDGICRKTEILIGRADSSDAFVIMLDRLVLADENSLAAVYANIGEMSYDEASRAVTDVLYGVYGDMYRTVATMRGNAIVGEYTMTRLAALFGVPLPEFERPGFVRTGEAVEAGKGDSDDKPSGSGSDGGLGEGATFGSKDLVLDPITGTYREYGEIISKYYGIMYEKIENGSYTEDQVEAIIKYFALLYGGIEDK